MQPEGHHVPGLDQLGPRVAQFDEWFDARLEPLRGNPVADRIFTAASHLGDFSLLWQIATAAKGLSSERAAAESLLISALIGAESLIVNQGVKRLFRRTRPTESGDERYDVRRPTTSSFPSGHASSAVFAASLLAARSPAVVRPLWYALAGVVVISRPFVRIHHASDVVAGVATGLALAAVARRIIRR